MGMPEKVIKFENENMKIYEAIQGWIKELNRNNRDFTNINDNKGTQTAYEHDVRLFFRLLGKEKGSELEYLTMDEIQITLDDFEEFKEKLMDLKDDEGKYLYTNKSINRKVSAVKSFVKYMAKRKIDGEPIIKDASYLNLVTSEKEKENHYGALEVSEVFQMADIVANGKSGNVKRLMILFALDTCIRQNALLNLKWNNFIEKEDGVLVQGIDKGNKEFRQLISKDFYNELLTIKTDDSEFVFNLTKRQIFNMMNMLKKKMKIQPERNIVFHSIRKSGITYRYRITGDILEAKRAANHSSIMTTQLYVQAEDYGAIGAVSSAGKLDNELYKKVDLEVLQQAISNCPKDLRFILNLKIHELKTKNN